jgi:SAM-dependent methyltransferase
MLVNRRNLFPLVFAPQLAFGQATANDREWSTFVAWVNGLPQGAFRNQIEAFPTYRKKLIGDGMPTSEAEALATRIQKRSINNPEWTAVNFDRIYRGAGDRFVKPNAFLIETVKGLKPGPALDLGMGQGRNAIFLAQQGWEVTGLELSPLGVAEAKERARKVGVRIDARAEDVYSYNFGESRWDLVCVMYFIIPNVQAGLYQKIATSLRAGGRVIVEGTGTPALDTLLAERAKWEATNLKLVRLEYLDAQSDWSSAANGVAHMVLQKH